MTNPDRIQRLERLLQLSRSLPAAPDLESLLKELIAAAAELTACEAASILCLEEGGETLGFLALPWFHRQLLQEIKVPVHNSLTGWVILNSQPLIIQDVSSDPRHFKGADQASGFVTRSLLAVPILYQSEVLGVLEAVNKHGAPFTDEDLFTLETIAAQAALALQAERLDGQAHRSASEEQQLDHMKSNFIAIASHELRTPLGLILGHASFLREAIQGEHRSQLDIIVRNAMRLKEIIDSIANIDNVQQGVASLRRQSFSIQEMIEEVYLSFLEAARQKGVNLRTDTGKSDLQVDGDASKVSMALGNLVKNAIDFTDPGGHVLILVEQIIGYAKVSVIDDGIGIPLKDLPHIFERFYQVESHLTRKHGGMGLGLSVAKVMIDMHGGRIWVESVEGKGTNFTFILPLEAAPPTPANRVFIS